MHREKSGNPGSIEAAMSGQPVNTLCFAPRWTFGKLAIGRNKDFGRILN
jgi:hypothetical protein